MKCYTLSHILSNIIGWNSPKSQISPTKMNMRATWFDETHIHKFQPIIENVLKSMLLHSSNKISVMQNCNAWSPVTFLLRALVSGNHTFQNIDHGRQWFQQQKRWSHGRGRQYRRIGESSCRHRSDRWIASLHLSSQPWNHWRGGFERSPMSKQRRRM